MPVAITPAARPAMVPSVMLGNTLLVPVEMGTSGTSPHSLATARFVPSPPSVTMHSTSALRISLAALYVSASS